MTHARNEKRLRAALELANAQCQLDACKRLGKAVGVDSGEWWHNPSQVLPPDSVDRVISLAISHELMCKEHPPPDGKHFMVSPSSLDVAIRMLRAVEAETSAVNVRERGHGASLLTHGTALPARRPVRE